MAYVSNVIGRLESEIADETVRVARFLARSLPLAQRICDSDLLRGPDLAAAGEPPKTKQAKWNIDPHLSPWDRLCWPFLSADRQWAIAKRRPRYRSIVEAYVQERARHERDYAARRSQYDQHVAQLRTEVRRYNDRVAALRRARDQGDRKAAVELSHLRLDAFFEQAPLLPPLGHRVVMQEGSKRLLVELLLPVKAEMPTRKKVRFLKTTGEHRYTYRSETELRRLYLDFVAQAVLATISAALSFFEPESVESIVVNGVVNGVDPATGSPTRVPIVSVATSRSEFASLMLSEVDAVACLKHLSAAVSKNPVEMTPIRPIATFDTNDPRFVKESDVLGQLDSRPNLLDLTPGQFESLIQNLFSAMGLDTKQTQPSRDGGVDAVAFDHRPVLGGKVIIQAKRYKNTVGVSAVRDLYGAVLNEGASKGILVTTSGYGNASFDFAKGKPIELLDGTHLLYLLREHAKVEARIVVPDEWQEPSHGHSLSS